MYTASKRWAPAVARAARCRALCASSKANRIMSESMPAHFSSSSAAFSLGRPGSQLRKVQRSKMVQMPLTNLTT